MLEAGHAENALPQTARAIVNCRILPEETPDQTRETLARVMADPAIKITPVQTPRPSEASKLSPAIMGPVERVTARLLPGVPVIPQMETGATDGAYLRGRGHSDLRRQRRVHRHGRQPRPRPRRADSRPVVLRRSGVHLSARAGRRGVVTVIARLKPSRNRVDSCTSRVRSIY